MVVDSSTDVIDRVFDLVDNFADRADRVLNRAKHTEDQHLARRGKRPLVIDTASTVKVDRAKGKSEAPKTAPSTAPAPQKFRIVEAIDAKTGQTIFAVTNGSSARAECTTRELAQKILLALSETP